MLRDQHWIHNFFFFSSWIKVEHTMRYRDFYKCVNPSSKKKKDVIYPTSIHNIQSHIIVKYQKKKQIYVYNNQILYNYISLKTPQ